ncbi:unnamed protein product [Phytophthora lilii]|uniref:Ubiquitin-like-conjugating enzyme ATG10 n=1 Tax=Phytophthora lilii TaxID=2077276 RepID=A0A9W6U751_9STRA|nr:unnamed protein product [Phytophthora lilii]
MRPGALSYEQFCAEAELLRSRSHELASKQAVGAVKCVATWEWRHGNRQDDLTDEDKVQTTSSPQDAQTALLEFHIVYHTIYQTPVLYFRALAVDGTPLPPGVVTRDVQFPGSDGRSTFVAMEEHPVLGKPFSFLHPCETAAAMQLLQCQVQPAATETVVPHSSAEQPQEAEEVLVPRLGRSDDEDEAFASTTDSEDDAAFAGQSLACSNKGVGSVE